MPKILITYNPIMDEVMKAHCLLLSGTPVAERASQKTDIALVQEKRKAYKKLWEEIGNDKIFEAIEKMTHRPFPDSRIIVNLVSAARTTESNTMIIPINHDPDNFVLTLMHELMHRATCACGCKYTPEFIEKYKNETTGCRDHIVVNAMTEYLWRDVIGKPEYVDMHKARCAKNNAKDHIRAWKIIDEVGYKKIVDEYLIK